MRRLAGFNIVVALLPISVLAQATVEGRVGLPKSHSAPVVAKRYEIVTRGGALSTQPPLAVVYLAGAFPKIKSSSTKQIAQKDLAFVPPLLPVQVGTRVEFPNLDDTYHSIFSYSPAKRFDLGRYRPEERPIPSEVFDTSGLVTLRCDIHEHMRAHSCCRHAVFCCDRCQRAISIERASLGSLHAEGMDRQQYYARTTGGTEERRNPAH